MLETAQWVVLALSGLASFFYNDGRDHQLRAVMGALFLIGGLGTGLFFLAEATRPVPSTIPHCDLVFEDGEFVTRCQPQYEVARRAASDSVHHFLSAWIYGPMIEAAAVTVAGVGGLAVASATNRRPTDGRSWKVRVEDD